MYDQTVFTTKESSNITDVIIPGVNNNVYKTEQTITDKIQKLSHFLIFAIFVVDVHDVTESAI